MRFEHTTETAMVESSEPTHKVIEIQNLHVDVLEKNEEDLSNIVIQFALCDHVDGGLYNVTYQLRTQQDMILMEANYLSDCQQMIELQPQQSLPLSLTLHNVNLGPGTYKVMVHVQAQHADQVVLQECSFMLDGSFMEEGLLRLHRVWHHEGHEEGMIPC